VGKYSVIILLGVIVLILGLTSPFSSMFGPRLDPVPNSQKVAHSSHCAGCHGPDKTAQSLVDAEGNDVNIHEDWQISMMGLSAHDPFWRATVAHEVNIYPEAKEEIESTCLKCHAPLGSIESRLNGHPYSMELMLMDSLGLDGVSCSSCHQQPEAGLGSGHSGNFEIDTNRLMFGPYPNPVQGPMQIYVGFDPVFADHIYNSGICSGCHTLITETLDDDGLPSGEFFVEQATYHEWLNSVYPSQGKECQTCHLPFIEDSVVIATDLLALKKRFPFGLHQFFGANTAMLTMMHENKDELGLPGVSSNHAWNESIENNRLSLSKAATVELKEVFVVNDTLYFDVHVTNKTGHKLPSGYPSRISWLEVILTDDQSNDTLYQNGLMDQNGNITGRNMPYEPHHEIVLSEDDVQIYEMVMSDLNGHLTTRLNGAVQPFKDNRLLPLGFRRTHPAYDTVAVWGSANQDLNYTDESNRGSDKIQYRVALNGRKGFADLQVAMRYHTFPSRWMDDLFQSDSIEEVAVFKSMYAGYEDFVEVIDAASIDDIDLSTTAVRDIEGSVQFKIYPNPGTGNMVIIENSKNKLSGLNYQLVDIRGAIIQRGAANEKIILPDNMSPGLYYFILFEKGKSIASISYSVF